MSRMRVGSLSCSKTRSSKPLVFRSLNLFAPYISCLLWREKLPEAVGSSPCRSLLPNILAKPLGPPYDDKRCLFLLCKTNDKITQLKICTHNVHRKLGLQYPKSTEFCLPQSLLCIRKLHAPTSCVQLTQRRSLASYVIINARKCGKGFQGASQSMMSEVVLCPALGGSDAERIYQSDLRGCLASIVVRTEGKAHLYSARSRTSLSSLSSAGSKGVRQDDSPSSFTLCINAKSVL